MILRRVIPSLWLRIKRQRCLLIKRVWRRFRTFSIIAKFIAFSQEKLMTNRTVPAWQVSSKDSTIIMKNPTYKLIKNNSTINSTLKIKKNANLTKIKSHIHSHKMSYSFVLLLKSPNTHQWKDINLCKAILISEILILILTFFDSILQYIIFCHVHLILFILFYIFYLIYSCFI